MGTTLGRLLLHYCLFQETYLGTTRKVYLATTINDLAPT